MYFWAVLSYLLSLLRLYYIEMLTNTLAKKKFKPFSSTSHVIKIFKKRKIDKIASTLWRSYLLALLRLYLPIDSQLYSLSQQQCKQCKLHCRRLQYIAMNCTTTQWNTLWQNVIQVQCTELHWLSFVCRLFNFFLISTWPSCRWIFKPSDSPEILINCFLCEH